MPKASRTLSITLFALAPALVVARPAPAADDDAVAAIRRTFSAYRQALLSDDGEAAAALVAEDTLAYFDRARRLALTASPKATKALGLFDRLMVLRIRHEIEAETLKPLTGRRLFAFGVDRGWVDKQSVKSNQVGEVEVKGDTAMATFAQYPRGPKALAFAREGGRWKLDLTKLFGLAEGAMAQVFDREGMTQDEVIFMLLEQMSGEKPTAAIWEPLGA